MVHLQKQDIFLHIACYLFVYRKKEVIYRKKKQNKNAKKNEPNAMFTHIVSKSQKDL